MSAPDNRGKKAPQFTAFKPLTTVQNTSDCCCGGICSSTPTLSENVSGIHYGWRASSMGYTVCARRVKNAARQLTGVNQVQVLLATGKLAMDADNDIWAQVRSAVQKTGYSLRDKQASNELQESRPKENLLPITLVVMTVISWGLEQFNYPFGQLTFTATTLVGLYPIARQASRLIKSGSYFTIETLMNVAATGALFIGVTTEAAMVLLLSLIGERLEDWAASRARQGVSALMALRPETATRLCSDEHEEMTVNSLWPGDVIEAVTGGRLPASGKLLSPSTSFDESAPTGESIPVEHVTDDKVPTGATNVDRLVTLEMLSKPSASAIDRALKLAEEAEERRAPIERFIGRFNRIYTPAIIAATLPVTLVPPLLFAASWQRWIYKELTLLLIDCPCILAISIPAAITPGLAAAARHGTLIKGGAALEQLGHVTLMAFDKTGTLIVDKPRVTTVHLTAGINESELLTPTVAAEQGAAYPLAQAIVREAQAATPIISTAESQRALVGSGIEAQVNSGHVLICAAGKHPADAFVGLISELESTGQMVVLIVRNDDMLGVIMLQDTLRVDVTTAISKLSVSDVKGVILTGDNPRTATAVAGELGLEFKAGPLPEDKIKTVTELNQHAPLATAGDGTSGVPATKAAAIGIVVGSGTDAALETADVTLTHSHLCGLVQAIELVRTTHTNIRQSIAAALGPKDAFLITTLLGMTDLQLAVLVDTGAAVLVTANTLRLLHRK